jgi:hypothetical protein
MTISTETRRAGPYSGNGSTQVFAFSFKTFAAADLQVVTTTSGVDTVQTLTTHYTVSLNADQNASPGGSITMLTAPATGTTLTIISDRAFAQTLNVQNAGAFLPEAINTALDTLVVQTTQLLDQQERSLRGALSDAAWDRLPPASERAGGLLGFDDSTGQPMIADFGTVEALAADINTVAAMAADIAIVADADVDIATVADNITDVTTVADWIGTGGGVGAAEVTSTGSTTPRTLADRFAETFCVEDYGAVGDGTTNDAAAIQAAIDAAEAVNGGEVIFGAKTYAIASGLTITTNNVLLRGQGYDQRHDVGTAMVSTTVLKATTAMTTMVLHAPTEGASAKFLVGGGVVGMELDCDDTTDEGLHVKSVRYGQYDLAGRAANTYLFRFGVATTLGEGEDTQNCNIRVFGDQRGSTGVGFECYGNLSIGANFSYNQFVSVTIQHTDATGIIIGNSDNNTFQLLRATRASGTGAGIIFEGANDAGTCRDNTFYRVASNASVIARGTSSYTNASDGNIIFDYDKANGIPDPTIETGATLYWRSNLNNRWNFLDLQATGALRFGGTSMLEGVTADWTPTVAATSGTITTVTTPTARYTRIGPFVMFTIVITVTDNGTGAGSLTFTLPSTPAYAGACVGRNATNGNAALGMWTTTSTVSVATHAAAYPVASGQTLRLSGMYAAA